jgi:hypothetical protein
MKIVHPNGRMDEATHCREPQPRQPPFLSLSPKHTTFELQALHCNRLSANNWNRRTPPERSIRAEKPTTPTRAPLPHSPTAAFRSDEVDSQADSAVGLSEQQWSRREQRRGPMAGRSATPCSGSTRCSIPPRAWRRSCPSGKVAPFSPFLDLRSGTRNRALCSGS